MASKPMDHETVIRLRRVVAKLSRHLNSTSTGEGLTPSQSSALGLIATRGPLGLADLTEIENLNPTMLSRVVGKLDEAGLIRRVPDPADLRTAWVETTPLGEAVHERIKAQRTAIVSESAAHLSSRQAEALLRALPALEALAEELQRRGKRLPMA